MGSVLMVRHGTAGDRDTVTVGRRTEYRLYGRMLKLSEHPPAREEDMFFSVTAFLEHSGA